VKSERYKYFFVCVKKPFLNQKIIENIKNLVDNFKRSRQLDDVNADMNTVYEHWIDSIERVYMRLEEQFYSNYDLVSHLRHVIRVRKIRNNILRVSWLMVSSLIIYKLADYGVPYILDLYN